MFAESPKKKGRRVKTSTACLYCRRSHMTCSEERPCLRCIKRNIGHLCRDEAKTRYGDHQTSLSPQQITSDLADSKTDHLRTSSTGQPAPLIPGNPAPDHTGQPIPAPAPSDPVSLPMSVPIPGQGLSSDFYHLEDFTSIFNEDLFPSLHSSGRITPSSSTSAPPSLDVPGVRFDVNAPLPSTTSDVGTQKHITTDEFMLTAADPDGNTSERRLSLVINAKHQAGLLQPYNYPAGYDRLKQYMDQYMSEKSRQRILRSLATFRPAFRAIAKAAPSDALELVEETFERMQLDYDRIFAAMSMPACLWRRTGEIYRANKEFAELVGTPVEELRESHVGIYELMTEESAVRYWEKFASVAFQADRKAVMTTCNLRNRSGRKRRQCCFCFTIRRDRHNVPICIVGNFVPIKDK